MTNDDQKPGVPHGGTDRRGLYARQGRRRAKDRAGVLCGGDKGYAEVGDWGGSGLCIRGQNLRLCVLRICTLGLVTSPHER